MKFVRNPNFVMRALWLLMAVVCFVEIFAFTNSLTCLFMIVICLAAETAMILFSKTHTYDNRVRASVLVLFLGSTFISTLGANANEKSFIVIENKNVIKKCYVPGTSWIHFSAYNPYSGERVQVLSIPKLEREIFICDSRWAEVEGKLMATFKYEPNINVNTDTLVGKTYDPQLVDLNRINASAQIAWDFENIAFQENSLTSVIGNIGSKSLAITDFYKIYVTNVRIEF